MEMHMGGRASRRSVTLALLAVAAMSGYWSQSERASTPWVDLSTPRGSLRVLVANDAAERSQGLSERDDLPSDGMLLQPHADNPDRMSAGRHHECSDLLNTDDMSDVRA